MTFSMTRDQWFSVGRKSPTDTTVGSLKQAGKIKPGDRFIVRSRIDDDQYFIVLCVGNTQSISGRIKYTTLTFFRPCERYKKIYSITEQSNCSLVYYRAI